MEVKLEGCKTYNYQDFLKECETGGRFIVYQWIIPLPLFIPIKRLSRVYFIDNSSPKTKYALKYNIINLLLGWWGLPFGPPYLFKSIILNMKGGIDVTEDLMLNINEDNFCLGRVEIKEKAIKYIPPSKTEKKEFVKVFNKLFEQKIVTQTPIIGYYIDTDKDEKPYYVIGISDAITNDLETAISKEVYQRFYKHMQYKLVDVNSEFETKQALIKQGIKINCTVNELE